MKPAKVAAPDAEKSPGSASTVSRTLPIRPWMLVACAMVPTLAVVLAWAFPRERATTAPPSFIVKRVPGAHATRHIGPWGELVSTPITVQAPPEFIPPAFYSPRPVYWSFAGKTRSAVAQMLSAVGLDAGLQSRLLAGLQETADGLLLRVDPQLVLEIPVACRGPLYARLRELNENNAIVLETYYFSEAEREEFRGDLPAAVFEIFDKLVYPSPRGSRLCFSDRVIANLLVEGERDRLTLLRLLSRERTLLLTLAVDPSSNVTEIRDYWKLPTTRRQIMPVLESLVRQPRGASLDLLHLMPSFVREYAYAYPVYMFPLAEQDRPDCLWTCVNFTSRMSEGLVPFDQVQRVLDTGFEPFRGPEQFGDVMMLVRDRKTVLHAAVVVADNIVFTKNGRNALQPWIFVTKEDLYDLYPEADPGQTVYLRRKPVR